MKTTSPQPPDPNSHRTWTVTNRITGATDVSVENTLNSFRYLRRAEEWASAYTNPQDSVVLCNDQPFWDADK